jgi:glutamate dehydrogenase
MDAKAKVESDAPPLEGVLDAISASADPERAPALKSFAQEMLGRATADFFADHGDGEVAEIMTSVFDLLESTSHGEVAVRVRQRSEVGRWGRAEVIIGDRPFTVDTVRQYLNHRGFEIRHQLHPVVCVERGEDGAITEIRDWRATPDRTSVIFTEFEGHLDDDLIRDLEENLRLCMHDLRLATGDFRAMLAKTDDTIEVVWGYGERGLRPAEEVEEIIAFLEWLKEVGFVFPLRRSNHSTLFGHP